MKIDMVRVIDNISILGPDYLYLKKGDQLSIDFDCYFSVTSDEIYNIYVRDLARAVRKFVVDYIKTNCKFEEDDQ